MRYPGVIIGGIAVGLSALCSHPALATPEEKPDVIARLQYMWPCQPNGSPSKWREWRCSPPYSRKSKNNNIKFIDDNTDENRTYIFAIPIRGKIFRPSIQEIMDAKKPFIFVENKNIVIYLSDYVNVHGDAIARRVTIKQDFSVEYVACDVKLSGPFLKNLQDNIYPLNDYDLIMRYVENHLYVDGADTIDSRLTNCTNVKPYAPNAY